MKRIWQTIINNGDYKVVKDQNIATKFDSLITTNLYSSLNEIVDKKSIEKIKTDPDGITSLHKYIDASLRTKIQDAVSAKIKLSMLKLTIDLAKQCLSFDEDHDFLMDLMVIVRIHFPIEFAKKSTQTYLDYSKDRGRTIFKIDPSITSAYHNNLPFAAWSHGPHCDSWVGHSYDGINLWWAYDGVTDENGVTLYPDFVGLDLKDLDVIEEPPYVNREVSLGIPFVPKMSKGEVLAFNSDLLHGTRVNTSNKTRISISTRINPNIPKFNKNVFRFVKLWAKSSKIKFLDVKDKLPSIEDSHSIKSTLIESKNNPSKFYFTAEKDNENHSNTCKKINLNNISIKKKSINIFGNNLELLIRKENSKSNTVSKFVCYKDEIKNSETIIELEIITEKGRNNRICIRRNPKTNSLIAHSLLCPHLGYSLSHANMKNEYLVCQGHGLEFKQLDCKSKSKSGMYCLDFYSIFEDTKGIFLEFIEKSNINPQIEEIKKLSLQTN